MTVLVSSQSKPVENQGIESVSAKSVLGCIIESGKRRAFDRATIAELDQWMTKQFKTYIWQASYAEPAVDFVVARLGDQMIGRCAIVTRDVLLDGQPLKIQGIAGLIVKPDFQHKGLGHEIMELSMKIVRASPVDFCILMCNREKLMGFYTQFGFKEIPGQNALFFDAEKEETVEYKPGEGVTMVHSNSGKAWTAGNLDLNGLPF